MRKSNNTHGLASGRSFDPSQDGERRPGGRLSSAVFSPGRGCCCAHSLESSEEREPPWPKKAILNPIRALVNWAKRVVYETIARELAEEATGASGYSIEPLEIEHGTDVPAIEYSSE